MCRTSPQSLCASLTSGVVSVLRVCVCAGQKAEQELSELHLWRDQVQQEQQKLRQQVAELEGKSKELSRLLGDEKQG